MATNVIKKQSCQMFSLTLRSYSSWMPSAQGWVYRALPPTLQTQRRLRRRDEVDILKSLIFDMIFDKLLVLIKRKISNAFPFLSPSFVFASVPVFFLSLSLSLWVFSKLLINTAFSAWSWVFQVASNYYLQICWWLARCLDRAPDRVWEVIIIRL